MSNPPIFKAVFGDAWDKLPEVFLKHYANRRDSNDARVAKGRLQLRMSGMMRLASPFLRLTKTLVPRHGEDVETTVRFLTNGRNFVFDRSFRFCDGEVFSFRSVLEPLGGNEMVEWTSSGIGWHCRYFYEDQKIHLKHCGYRLKLFGRQFRFPAGYILGRPEAHEIAVDDTSFDMEMIIRHPVFGDIYGYSGRFKMEELG